MEIFAAFVAFRKRNGLKELLFLRPKDAYYYMLPGEKQLPGEDIQQSLQRGLDSQSMVANDIKHLGTVSGHTSDGRVQILHLFSGDLDDTMHPAHEAAWMDKTRFYLNNGFMTDSTLRVTVPYLETEGHW